VAPEAAVVRSQAAIDRFADALWIEDGLAPLTLAAYRRDLLLYAEWLAAEHDKALDDSREPDLLGYITHRHAGTRATTVPGRRVGARLREHADGHLLGDDPQPAAAVPGRHAGRQRAGGGHHRRLAEATALISRCSPAR
jgi:hypothetical protein